MRLVMNKTAVSRLTKVRHRNELNSTLSSLPMSAKKVLFLVLSQINTKNEFDDNHIFYLTANDYVKWVNVNIDTAYCSLKEGAIILDNVLLKLKHEEIIELSDELQLPFTSKNAPDYINLSLTEFSAYYKNEGKIGVRFTKSAKQYLCKLVGSEKKYTTQILLSVVKLSSVNSSSIYQLIRKKISNNSRIKFFDISINELKDEMYLYDVDRKGRKVYSYPEYPFFKRDVLNKAVKEITKFTEIKDLKFEVIDKIGRKVSKLRFTFFTKEDEAKQNFTLEEQKFLASFDKNVYTPVKKRTYKKQ